MKECAYLIAQNFRQTDTVFRYGGEEFAVILTETSAKTACVPLERLRRLFENHQFKFNGEVFKVTLSIGVSSNTSFDTYIEMFDDADKAVYDAKNSGRNMVRQAIEKI